MKKVVREVDEKPGRVQVVLRAPVTTATELHEVDRQIASLEARAKELRGQLLESLKRQGVTSVKLEDGTMYLRVPRTTLKATSDAWGWAEEHNALKIDTAKALKIMKLLGTSDKLPKGFTRTDSEHLTIRRPNQDIYEQEDSE